MDDQPKEKWYFKNSTLVVAFLSVGPLALPLVWINPRFSRMVKIVITIITIILTYFLGLAVVGYVKSISSFYETIF